MRETEKRLATQIHFGLFGYLKPLWAFHRDNRWSLWDLHWTHRHHWNIIETCVFMEILHSSFSISCFSAILVSSVLQRRRFRLPVRSAHHDFGLNIDWTYQWTGTKGMKSKGWEFLFSQSNLLAKIWHAVYTKFKQKLPLSANHWPLTPQTVKFRTFYPTFVVHVAHPACLRHCGQILPKNRRC